MTESMIEKIKHFLLNPVEIFQGEKGDEPKEVFSYFIVLVLISSILTASVAAIGIGTAFGVAYLSGAIVGIFVSAFIGSLIFILIFAVWLHLWVHVLGGENGIMETVKAVIYASNPIRHLGWIPVIEMIFSIWTVVLAIFGVHKMQDLSTKKTIMTVVIAGVVVAIIMGILMFIFAAIFFTALGYLY